MLQSKLLSLVLFILSSALCIVSRGYSLLDDPQSKNKISIVNGEIFCSIDKIQEFNSQYTPGVFLSQMPVEKPDLTDSRMPNYKVEGDFSMTYQWLEILNKPNIDLNQEWSRKIYNGLGKRQSRKVK